MTYGRDPRWTAERQQIGRRQGRPAYRVVVFRDGERVDSVGGNRAERAHWAILARFTWRDEGRPVHIHGLRVAQGDAEAEVRRLRRSSSCDFAVAVAVEIPGEVER